MPTARTLVTDGLSLIGVQAAEEPLTAHQEQQGLRILNDLIQSASLEQFVIYYMPPQTVVFPPGMPYQSWGPGGDIPTPRPLQIGQEAQRLEAAATYLPVVVLSLLEFRATAVHGDQRGIPQCVTYASDYPLGGLYCWPMPQEPTTIIVYPWTVLTTWPDFDTDLLLPPGYDRYLKSGVACELAPYYEREPSPIVLGLRAEAKNNIKVVNLTIPVLEVPQFADPFLWQRG